MKKPGWILNIILVVPLCILVGCGTAQNNTQDDSTKTADSEPRLDSGTQSKQPLPSIESSPKNVPVQEKGSSSNSEMASKQATPPKSSIVKNKTEDKYTPKIETQPVPSSPDKTARVETASLSQPISNIKKSPSSTETPAALKLQYFWHESYHAMPHDPACKDTNWHPYLNAKPGDGGDPEKYTLLDVQPEEIDVSSYPEDLRLTYKNIIRKECNQCHSQARCLYRRFTPKQWKTALLLLQRRYETLTDEKMVKLWKFFVYREEELLRKQEE